MKRYDYCLNHFEIDLFSKTIIRDKISIVKTLMGVCNSILTHEVNNQNYNMSIIIERMSRFFVFLNDKYYSISFPFQIEECEEKLSIYYQDLEINAKMVSLILQTLNELEKNDKIYFVDDLASLNSELLNEDLFVVLRMLFEMESGYVRYDYDLKNFKGKQHPIHHIDIMYSNAVTFKLGLGKQMEKQDFIDLLDTKTDCMFIEQSRTAHFVLL